MNGLRPFHDQEDTMRHPYRYLTIVVVAGWFATVSGLCFADGKADSAKQITPKVLKFDGLVKLLQANRGKVVVVDFWADS